MKKLSTGEDSTLGNYLKLSKLVFGGSSNAVKFLESKIEESPNGEAEEVISDETQMVYLLMGIDHQYPNS